MGGCVERPLGVAPLKRISSSFRGAGERLDEAGRSLRRHNNIRKARSNVFPPGGMDPLSVPVVGFA